MTISRMVPSVLKEKWNNAEGQAMMINFTNLFAVNF
jgi:hypothetical protein